MKTHKECRALSRNTRRENASDDKPFYLAGENICKCKKPGIVTDNTYCFKCHKPTKHAKPKELV